MTVDSEDNVGIALGLVLAAGASTALGAAVVFFPSIVKLASRRVLAGSLGFSAGVMAYISFIEIFPKSNTSFEDAGHSEDDAYLYATLCFFGGVLLMSLLNMVVGFLLGETAHRQDANTTSDSKGHDTHGHNSKPPGSNETEPRTTTRSGVSKQLSATVEDADDAFGGCAYHHGKDPVSELDSLQHMASVLRHEQEDQTTEEYRKDENCCEGQEVEDDDFVDTLDEDDPFEDNPNPSNITMVASGGDKNRTEAEKSEEEKKRLVAMGMNTAIAIGLHNFPEGLATFVAALHEPRVGAVLAFAIAIHNIPEGLCVALPIYYSTGNRWQAFGWALLSGASEFIAALLGWAVLASLFSDSVYGILFGFVSGMMVTISIRELLPTAHFYDPEDGVVTSAFIGGMIVMALSLVLFLI